MFFANSLQVPEADLSGVVFQQVHRLRRFRRGVAPGGQPQKPRPIIVGFRDYKTRQEIFQLAPRLRGTEFYIQKDFPAEIQSARMQYGKA